MMELTALVREAQSAPPNSRIEWRDRIAAHGARGIEAVQPWLADDVLSAFAVRVVYRAGVNGEAELASGVLRAARPCVPSAVTGDVEEALRGLRQVTHPRQVQQAGPAATEPVRRGLPRATPVARRRSR